ncbi:unnamed protein product [Ectocarpus sp. 12 AP-2014]
MKDALKHHPHSRALPHAKAADSLKKSNTCLPCTPAGHWRASVAATIRTIWDEYHIPSCPTKQAYAGEGRSPLRVKAEKSISVSQLPTLAGQIGAISSIFSAPNLFMSTRP